MRVYIINGRVTIKKLDDRPHHGYFMVYAATAWVILYWNPYQPFVIHRPHKFWFNEYNSCLSIEYKHTVCYLLLQKYPESVTHNSDFINLIPCELDLESTPSINTTILTYDIELPPSVKKKIIYWMMKILQYLISLIKSKIHQLVINFQHRKNEMCVSLL